MTDLAVLALGVGVMPVAAILLYTFSDRIGRAREASWGILAGIVVFVGLSHAMALVLVNHSLFADEGIATLVGFFGLAIGAGLAWLLFEGPLVRTEPSRILWAAVAFLVLHSVSDGLVLGAAFAGGLVPTIPVDAVTVGGTAVHRFAEGALVIVPAIAAAWKPRSAFVVLFVALASVPAAYVPGWIFSATAGSIRPAVQLAVPTFFSAVEASFALFLIVRGFLPLAMIDHGTRWPVWTAIGFVGMALVHFLIE